MKRARRAVFRRLPHPARELLLRVASPVRAAMRPRPRWGNLRRTEPFSDYFGFDRGTPIDRYYLDRFFADYASGITKAVLEVKDPAFTNRFGHDVESVDLVDIDPRNRRSTILADLADPGSLPAASWDCVIAPQTLNLVDDPAAAIRNLWQAVRPGGVLLVTAPSLARLEPQLREIDRWRFLPEGLGFLLAGACPDGVVTVRGYGSLVTATAFLHGLAAEELRDDELEHNDPAHAILACARVERPLTA